MKKTVTFIIKLILGLILMLSILAETLVLVASNTILNKDYMIKELDSQNYYANLYTNVLNEMENYIGPSGFDEKIFDGVVTMDKLEKDVHIVIGNIYDGKSEEVSSEEIEKKLEKNIKKFLKKHNMQVEDETSLKDFKSKIGEVYRDNVSYNTYTKYLKVLASSKLRKIVNLAKEGCFAAIIVCTILFILINIKERKKIITEVMTSLLACGIILAVACIYFETKVKIDAITLLNFAVSLLVRDIITNMITTIKNIGFTFIGISAVLIILNNFIFAESVKKHKHHKSHEHYEHHELNKENTEEG